MYNLRSEMYYKNKLYICNRIVLPKLQCRSQDATFHSLNSRFEPLIPTSKHERFPKWDNFNSWITFSNFFLIFFLSWLRFFYKFPHAYDACGVQDMHAMHEMHVMHDRHLAFMHYMWCMIDISVVWAFYVWKQV